MKRENEETFEFKSEAKQLLELMIHSIYSSKDVFLRELISNASDALDKLRFESLVDKSLKSSDEELRIRISVDKESRVLTLDDNGIGMNREDLIRDLGTIARSGTKEFNAKLEASTEENDIESLIGRFGVGFYSAFIAAKNVTVISRRAGAEEAFGFESSGDGQYRVFESTRETVGTTIRLELREADPDNDLDDFTQEWTLRSTVKKYSDFIQYPIQLEVVREEVERDEEGEPKAGVEPKEVRTWETINSMRALWTRSRSDVEDSEYAEFYKHLAHDWTAPLETMAIKGEGTFEYHALLFIPERAPMDLYYRDAKFGLQLYANRVMIMEQSKELLPDYLRFIKGVVDSSDLSLNVSREMLQKDGRVSSIRKHLIKKTLETLTTLQSDEPGKYQKFWDAFGRVLKEGVVMDRNNKEKITSLLLFDSSAVKPYEPVVNEDGEESTPEKTNLTTLTQYIERMKEGQEVIYFLNGESRAAVEKSPHLEAFFDKGFEVLYLTDPYDEIMIGSLTEFDGKKLQSVGKGAVDLGEVSKDDKEKDKDEEKVHSGLLNLMFEQLKDSVKEVRLSKRLTNSAACLVGEQGDYSPHFTRLLKQAGHMDLPETKRTLEVNPAHPLLVKMQARFDADSSDEMLVRHTKMLYSQALLAEGSPLIDPVEFSRQLAELMVEVL